MSVHGPRDVCHESMEYSTEHMHQRSKPTLVQGSVGTPAALARGNVACPQRFGARKD